MNWGLRALVITSLITMNAFAQHQLSTDAATRTRLQDGIELSMIQRKQAHNQRLSNDEMNYLQAYIDRTGARLNQQGVIQVIDSLTSGDMLYWAENAQLALHRIRPAMSNAATLKFELTRTDYAFLKNGTGFLDLFVILIDNHFSIKEIRKILGGMVHYGTNLWASAQIEILTTLYNRRGDDASRTRMLEEMLEAGATPESTVIARTFLQSIRKTSAVAQKFLRNRLNEKDQATKYIDISGLARIPDFSILEKIAEEARFKNSLIARYEKETASLAKDKKLHQWDITAGHRKALKTFIPEQLKTALDYQDFIMALAADRYEFVYYGDRGTSEHLAWIAAKEGIDHGLALGVSPEWMMALTTFAYYREASYGESGRLWEGSTGIEEYFLKIVLSASTRPQLERLLSWADKAIEHSYMNDTQHYRENFEKTRKGFAATVIKEKLNAIQSPLEFREFFAMAPSVDQVIELKRRLLHQWNDPTHIIGLLMPLGFSNPTAAYLEANANFISYAAAELRQRRLLQAGDAERILSMQTLDDAQRLKISQSIHGYSHSSGCEAPVSTKK